MRPETFRDRKGNAARSGDHVRVLAVPDLTGMSSPYREQTEGVFRHIKGTVKRVRSVDEYGNAILVSFIRAGQHAGYHSVAIEGEHVRKVHR